VKVAHRTQWRAEGGKRGDVLGHPTSEIAKIKML